MYTCIEMSIHKIILHLLVDPLFITLLHIPDSLEFCS